MTIKEAQETVDKWIKTYGVRYFSELICLANQTGVDLTEELQKSLEKKTQRDHDRHRNNPKLKSASAPPDNGQKTDKE